MPVGAGAQPGDRLHPRARGVCSFCAGRRSAGAAAAAGIGLRPCRQWFGKPEPARAFPGDRARRAGFRRCRVFRVDDRVLAGRERADPGREARRMRLHWRWRGRLWLLLPILAAAYVLLVLGASRFFGGERIDLTRDHLYTLSPGTRNIIAHLNQPIDLTLYFSDRASRGLPQLRAYHQHVLHLLEQVARRSHGRVHLTRIDPLPFSDDEDRATAAGLTSVRGEGTGESIFFGLAGRNAGDGRTSSIPFFLPAKEPFLEYDVARLLHDLSITREP